MYIPSLERLHHAYHHGSNVVQSFFVPKASAEIPDPVFLIWSTGSVFVREKDIAHISQIDALRCCPAMILILPIWDLWIDPLRVHLLVIIKHPHSMVSTMCGSPCKGQPWLGWREGTQTGPLWRLACPACSPSDRLQPPHSIAHFKRSKGKATKTSKPPKDGEVRPNRCLG